MGSEMCIRDSPMVIVYRLSALTYHVVRAFSHVRNAGMVNLIAGEQIVPELLQNALTPAAVADEVVRFLTDADLAARTRAALGGVRERLGAVGASRRAAEHVVALARQEAAASQSLRRG